MTIQEFCDRHNACAPGRKWALDNCTTMQEAWDKCENPEWLIWIATRRGVLDDKSLRLFSVWCCRQIQHFTPDPSAKAAIDIIEAYANGQASRIDLVVTYKDMYDKAVLAASQDKMVKYEAFAVIFLPQQRTPTMVHILPLCMPQMHCGDMQVKRFLCFSKPKWNKQLTFAKTANLTSHENRTWQILQNTRRPQGAHLRDGWTWRLPYSWRNSN